MKNISSNWNQRIFPSADISRIVFVSSIPRKSVFNMTGITFCALNVKYPPIERVGFMCEQMKGIKFKCD